MRTDRHAATFDREHWSRRANEVRARVSIQNVVERVVVLKGRGNSRQGLCPFHDEATPSFTVYPSGSSKIPVGFFVCYGCGAKGDVLAFVMKRQGLGYTETIELLESENGLHHLQASAPLPRRAPTPQVLDRRKLDRAQRVIRESVAIEAGSPVDLYLRYRAMVPPAEYGIGDAATNAGWPGDLRFHPRCWHDFERKTFPAMVAAIRGYDGTLLTAHQTYLAQRDDGSWTKAAIDKAKMVVGPYDPGFIRLGPDADRMVGGEGIESSLSAMQLCRRSGLAFVTAGRMKSVEPPFACSDFIYAADKGGKHRWGERFAQEGAKALAHGRKVAVKIPNIAADKGDFNDLLQQRAAERRSEVSA